jgi:hypothetical protein
MPKIQEVSDKLDELLQIVEKSRTNPGGDTGVAPKKQDVLSKLDELLQSVKQGRGSNPDAPTLVPTGQSEDRRASKFRKERDEVLAALEDVRDALDEGDDDEAQKIMDDVFSDYEKDDETSD